ncbi:MAG: hypothetical protein FWD26_01340 [Treponema sp.]|nr:hypothetical protein [Treponema sp.]
MEIMSYNILKLVLDALQIVGYPYYKVPTTDDRNKLQNRERVFCYEFYHRMRQIQDNHCKELTLNGELDKRGRINYNNEIPDFLFHIPGTDSNNEAIIEVKNSLQIITDLQKIDRFINEHNYKFGILIIYNNTFSKVQKEVKNSREKLTNIKNKENIYIIAASDHAHIKHILLSDILDSGATP